MNLKNITDEKRNKEIMEKVIPFFEAYIMIKMINGKIVIINIEDCGISESEINEEFIKNNDEFLTIYENYTAALQDWLTDIQTDIKDIGLYSDNEYSFYLSKIELEYLGFEEEILKTEYLPNIHEEIKNETFNYLEVEQNIFEFAKSETRKAGYELLQVMKYSNHPEHNYLYLVIAHRENALEGYKYVSWIMNDRGLDLGIYSNSFKKCLQNTADRMNEMNFENELESEEDYEME